MKKYSMRKAFLMLLSVLLTLVAFFGIRQGEGGLSFTAYASEGESETTGQDEVIKQRLLTIYEAESLTYLRLCSAPVPAEDFANRVSMQEPISRYGLPVVENQEIMDLYLEMVQSSELTVLEALQMGAQEMKSAAQTEETVPAVLSDENTEELQPEASTEEAEQTEPEEASADITDPSQMIWPLPSDGTVGVAFGPRIPPTEGASSYHKGIDVGDEYGAEIIAALAGTVCEAAYNETGGYHVYIDHGNGYITRYLHMSKMLCNTGDYVLQGQVIGLVGDSGVATGPHLHFSVYLNGTPVDPLDYVEYNAEEASRE